MEGTRAVERALASTLRPFESMARAGLATAQLALALAPHARCIWIACGPGNNGGDGLVAAMHLLDHSRRSGGDLEVVVTLCGDPARLPPDGARALSQALSAGLVIAPHPPRAFDCAIDALLGLGAQQALEGELAKQLQTMHGSTTTVLSVDLPSGLLADTGVYLGPAPKIGLGPRHTLSLLTLKPGLFTADGRDLSGVVWFDDLGCTSLNQIAPVATLHGIQGGSPQRAQVSHKGSQGNVVVIGGQSISLSGSGMTGAAILAARAALHAGSGRVYVGLLDGSEPSIHWDPQCPELMFRSVDTLQQDRHLLQSAATVCGCGGGSTVVARLPQLLSTCPKLVLDADALNAISGDDNLRRLTTQRAQRGWVTVLTPHPLEAARLLDQDTTTVMSDRLTAAMTVTRYLAAICVLKGSGTVITGPGQGPIINASGNSSLATAGTGDALAGMLGAALAMPDMAPESAFQAVATAVAQHGRLADDWDRERSGELTAGRLAMRARHLH
ncbi:NAD(P)H-hydrate dehydratase [Hydrogenophaga sp. A37]|uniref:NAD(P)H-hydrate dehydratase n=1 Tax=Hydrogenophaga sp. A37 TaxID=1945864 RepID=UPI00343BAC2F